MNFAKEVSKRTILMDDGIIVESGESKQFFDNPKEERTRTFLKLLEKE
jgi:cystine transport system ATP-binding protein/L-cystine transport system ATP-binding protein